MGVQNVCVLEIASVGVGVKRGAGSMMSEGQSGLDSSGEVCLLPYTL